MTFLRINLYKGIIYFFRKATVENFSHGTIPGEQEIDNSFMSYKLWTQFYPSSPILYILQNRKPQNNTLK